MTKDDDDSIDDDEDDDWQWRESRRHYVSVLEL